MVGGRVDNVNLVEHRILAQKLCDMLELHMSMSKVEIQGDDTMGSETERHHLLDALGRGPIRALQIDNQTLT